MSPGVPPDEPPVAGCAKPRAKVGDQAGPKAPGAGAKYNPEAAAEVAAVAPPPCQVGEPVPYLMALAGLTANVSWTRGAVQWQRTRSRSETRKVE